MLHLEAGPAHVRIDPAAGARLASLRVGDLELLVTDPGPDPVRWGCYPMAPWAGRVRRGVFRFAGREHRLPLRLPPHALHGTVLDRQWESEGEGRFRIDLGPDWPYPGHARQHVSLGEDALTLTLEVHADAEPFPATLGWHPWFRKQLDRGGPAALAFSAAEMYLRDAEGIPTGQRVAPGAGPYDDCFTGMSRPPTLTWPGALRLSLTSSCDHWVVYDQPEHALCVEPQSGPPDAFSLCPRVVEPGEPLIERFSLEWQEIRAPRS